MDLGMTLRVPGHQPTRRDGRRWFRRGCSVCEFLLFQFLSEECQHPHGEALQHVGEVVDQVPPVSYLEGIRRATPASAGVDAISVTADDFATRMFAEPINQRVG